MFGSSTQVSVETIERLKPSRVGREIGCRPKRIARKREDIVRHSRKRERTVKINCRHAWHNIEATQDTSKTLFDPIDEAALLTEEYRLKFRHLLQKRIGE